MITGLWTEQEDTILRGHAKTYSARQIAVMLGRSPKAVSSRAIRLGISLRKRGEYHPSSRHSDKTVRAAFHLCEQGYSSKRIAGELNVPLGTILQWLYGYNRYSAWQGAR